ncbi:TetR family transcriptional regulator [Lentzea sp. NPDC051838]|uniref:TetR/AcrR family transcriptional regulator n=1 Tax=Lentzea sp. NPDC051838 TaxID=3154849 RepID=UPI00342CA088
MPIRPPTHRASGLARREALLRAAIEVVASNGIEGATHRAIARAAGLPLSTTSYFFSSLDELLAAALTLAFAEVVERSDAAVKAMHDTNPSVEQLAEMVTDFLMLSPRTDLVTQFEVYLAVHRRPELGAAVAGVVESYERVISTSLRLVDIDPLPHRVRLVLAMLDGMAVHRVAFPRDDDREILRAALHDVLRGFQT